MNYNTFFLTATEKTTGSDLKVTGEKGGAKVENSQGAVAPATTDVQNNTNANTSVPATDVPAPSTGGFFGGGMSIFLIYGVFIAVFYFFVLKPQNKRKKEALAVIESLEVGDEVLLSSGYYGKITDVGKDICVVEFGTNKGVRIPVRKSEIVRKESPVL